MNMVKGLLIWPVLFKPGLTVPSLGDCFDDFYSSFPHRISNHLSWMATLSGFIMLIFLPFSPYSRAFFLFFFFFFFPVKYLNFFNLLPIQFSSLPLPGFPIECTLKALYFCLLSAYNYSIPTLPSASPPNKLQEWSVLADPSSLLEPTQAKLIIT